ncbi:MAG: SDR family NAD(P)-dependent oxidoreductase [Bacteroidales bacterium]|nr:SDR family NAD(P)-dependent oxidoreductase [Bacteroidales bacterium]
MKNYVITGATGNIGKNLAKELLSKGQKVKVVGRNAEKLQELVSLGAEALVGNVTNRNFVIKAFAGADAVFCLVTPDFHSTDVRKEQNVIVENYFEAVKANKIPNVVLLSSVGAHLRKGAGVVDGLGYMEEIFLQLKDTNVLNLRPTYFMENTLGMIGTIKQMGIAGNPVNPDVKFPIVATKDIAAVAAKRLLNLDFKNNSIEFVLGAKDYSYGEITAIAGKAIGKEDLKYVQFPYEDTIKSMVASGFCGEDAAKLMVDLAKAINDGTLLNGHTRTAANTTPTTYDEFSKTFAWVYQNS